MKRDTSRFVIVALGLVSLIVCVAALLFGCQEVDSSRGEFDDTDDTPRYWLVIVCAEIDRTLYEGDKFAADPWAQVYRDGFVEGETAHCVRQEWTPQWDDHIAALPAYEWAEDTWKIVVRDWAVAPTPDWLGGCELDTTIGEVEAGLSLHLENCQGPTQEITIRFERVTEDNADVDTEDEREPNC